MKLLPEENCSILISYTPLNNKVTDLEIDYSSNLKIKYVRDSKDTPTELNGFFSFLSTKIQGKFESNQPLVEFSEDVIVGNPDSNLRKAKNPKISTFYIK